MKRGKGRLEERLRKANTLQSPKTIRSKTGARSLQKQARTEHPPRVRLALLAQDFDDAYNVGSLFRVADAIGAEFLALSGRTPEPNAPRVAVTSLGAHRRVTWEKFDRHDEAADRLLGEGWTLVAVEIAEHAVPYFEYDFPQQTCLVLGSEQRGVTSGLMKKCAGAVFIPMRGRGRSMNVHVAGAIVAAHALHVGRDDLTPKPEVSDH